MQILEARDKTGGCCATTNIDGYTFNDGALCLILPNVLDHGFARLGLERHICLPLRKVKANHTTILPDGAIVTVGEGLQVSVEGGRGAGQCEPPAKRARTYDGEMDAGVGFLHPGCSLPPLLVVACGFSWMAAPAQAARRRGR